MHHETLEYLDGQQKLKSELFYDKSWQGTGKRSAILVFPAFEGTGEFAWTVAEKFAKQGYVTLAVDMYGERAVAKTLEACFRLISPFLQDRHLVRRRSVLAYSALKNCAEFSIDKIGAIGFCFGGMCVLEVARSGENLAAAVSVHGILSKSELPSSPIKSKILILQGYLDPQVPANALTQFAQEMQTAGEPDWIFSYFGHAQHSFTDPRAGSYDPVKEKTMGREFNPLAAERAFRYALDFFVEMSPI